MWPGGGEGEEAVWSVLRSSEEGDRGRRTFRGGLPVLRTRGGESRNESTVEETFGETRCLKLYVRVGP